MNLASELEDIEAQVRTSPWAGYEHSRGYAVMVLPVASDHLLGLRVFPQNDFAPYELVWHRTPEGDWSMYSDKPSLNTTCPRWWGPALRHAELTRIEVTWTGPNQLRVEMERPRLVWTMSMTAPALLRALNLVSAALPLWTWKPSPLLRIPEWMAKRFLGMGDLRFSFITPSRQNAVIMPERIYLIESSRATLEGADLGQPYPTCVESEYRRHPSTDTASLRGRAGARADQGARRVPAHAGAGVGALSLLQLSPRRRAWTS